MGNGATEVSCQLIRLILMGGLWADMGILGIVVVVYFH